MSTTAHDTALDADAPASTMPWCPPGEIVLIEGRGEFFVRHHRHPDPQAPTVLLLHGWTASADLQFFPAYPALAERYSIIGVDHRGHGRGLRTLESFALETVADDAAAVTRALGVSSVIAVGYSMGGPITLHLTRRHPDLVAGVVVQATALEWRGSLRERLTWRLLPLMGAALRSSLYPRTVARAIPRLVPDGHPLARHREWMLGEVRRNDPGAVIEAGRALATYDARDWVGTLQRPAAMLVTTKDRLVRPSKQRALAAALGADVREIAADHLSPIEVPDQFAAATLDLIGRVARRLPAAPPAG